MGYRSRTFGLALAAMLVAGSLAANVAMGAEEFFHSHKENTILTGEATTAQKFELVPNSGLVLECKQTKFSGTETGTKHESSTLGTTFTVTSVTVHMETSECSFSGHPATVNTHNCHFKLFAETTETIAGKAMGNIEIVECPTGAAISLEVPALGITMSVANQLIYHGIGFENHKPGPTEEWTVSVISTVGSEGKGEAGKPTGIHWTCTPKATCMSGIGANEGSEATRTGTVLVKGFSDLEKTATGTYKEGVQTGIWKGPAE